MERAHCLGFRRHYYPIDMICSSQVFAAHLFFSKQMLPPCSNCVLDRVVLLLCDYFDLVCDRWFCVVCTQFSWREHKLEFGGLSF